MPNTHLPRRRQRFTSTIFPPPAFPVNVLVCSTALTINIIAISRARHVEPVILASGIWTHISHASGSVSMQVPWLGIEPGPVEWKPHTLSTRPCSPLRARLRREQAVCLLPICCGCSKHLRRAIGCAGRARGSREVRRRESIGRRHDEPAEAQSEAILHD